MSCRSGSVAAQGTRNVGTDMGNAGDAATDGWGLSRDRDTARFNFVSFCTTKCLFRVIFIEKVRFFNDSEIVFIDETELYL